MTVMIPAPSRIRADAADQPWRSRALADIVYIGHRAVILRVAGDLMPLTAPGVGVMPRGAEIRDGSSFHALRDAVVGGRFPLADLTGWRTLAPDVVTGVDLALPHVSVSADAVALLGRALARVPVPSGIAAASAFSLRTRAAALVAALASGARLDGHLRSLIGAGPGTTPSGDDIVVGVLAGLRAVDDTSGAERLGRHVAPLLDRTTESSRYFLRHAVAARFAEHVHDAAAALQHPFRISRAVADAGAWGATSGLDLLAGLAAGATRTTACEAAA